MIRKKSNTKISIDGSVDNKLKSGTSENPRQQAHSTNKIKIISKSKDQNIIPMMNTFQLPSEQIKQNKNQYNYNKIKTIHFIINYFIK